MLHSDPSAPEGPKGTAHHASSELASLRVVGVNFRTAPAKFRSDLSLHESASKHLLGRLRNVGCDEAVVVSTCNRTEIYFRGPEFGPVVDELSGLCEVPAESIRECSYRLCGSEAVRQLFKVASGLDSAVLGEHEILGQLKSAYRAAKRAGTVASILDGLVQRAFRVGKRVRNESEISTGVTSIAAVALQKAAKLIGGLDHKVVLIVGAGQIAERIAKAVSHHEGAAGIVCNRTALNAARLAGAYGLQTRDYQDLEQTLSSADVVVGAVACPIPIMSIERISAARRDRPTVVIDLGVPPNVEPNGASPAIHLLNMETIVRSCRKSSDARNAAIPLASRIVDEEVESYERESVQRSASRCIGAVSERAEEIRKRNLDWALAQTPSAKERKLLEDLSIRIVRGMLEQPIEALKNDLRSPAERAVVARLFAAEAPQN